MKQIIISVAGTEGSREFKDVQILPGTKPRDVLSQLNLTGFQLNKPEGGAFGFNDDLYQAVADGQKLFATKADVEAGPRPTFRATATGFLVINELCPADSRCSGRHSLKGNGNDGLFDTAK